MRVKKGKMHKQLSVLELINQAGQLSSPQAVKLLYTDWLAANKSPLDHIVLFNLGVTHAETGDLNSAARNYQAALGLQPEFHQARFNLGSILERQGRPTEALAEWTRICEQPDSTIGDNRGLLILALNNRGRLLEGLKRLNEAEAVLTRSLLLDTEQPSVIHHWVSLRQKQCAWPVLKPLPGLPPEKLLVSASALSMFDLTDDPALQLAAAQRYVEEKVISDLPSLAGTSPYGHNRIRIGYLSSDFCLHPVSLLMVGLLEHHDRRRVEVYGFCWSPEDGSALRQRVLAALDHHIPIGNLSDEDASRLIRSYKIDVLVDLQGLTSGARPNILARRPAPCQLAYLGLPGTSGMPFIDYILCDEYTLPDAEQDHYSERPLRMPEVFQVSDGKRAVGPTPSRVSQGLPEKGVVFCAFNNPHKYTPEMFATWARILHRVPDSVLWLLADNSWVKENLLRTCEENGLDSDRLVFAPRALPPDYLARYRIADLFLDCFPFNGGTTANDALWMGLPVLTRSGRAFASRMAGSLLSSLGLDELITEGFAEYEELAVKLATDRQRLQDLTKRLGKARDDGPLFDMKAQARKLEDLLFRVADQKRLEIPVNAHPQQQQGAHMTLPKLEEASRTAIINFKVDTNWGVSDPVEFASLMGRLVQLVTPGYYAGDNLFTWGRNNSLFEDNAFRKSWEQNMQGPSDQAIAWRRYILACAAYHCAQLEGDFVECGVYMGSGIKTVVDYLGGTDFPRTFWGFDTFDSNPTGHSFPGQQDGLFDQVSARFNGYPQVRLVRGLLPDSLEGNSPEKIAYLHIDLNSAKYELLVLERLFERIVPGGVLILDDYEWAGVYREQKILEDQWFDARSYRVFPLPTGQGLVLKR